VGDVTFTAMTRFETNMRLELQQKTAKLAPTAVRRDLAGAEKARVDDLIANQSMRKKTERNGDVVHDTTGHDGIWLAAPDPGYLATLVDGEDKLMTRIDLQGAEIMTHSAAYNRDRDAGFIDGFFGNMITGKSGTTLNAFPAGNVVAVDWKGPSVAAAVTGMNVAKLRRMRRIFAENYVDLDAVELYTAMTANQIEELADDAKAINKDYTDVTKAVWSADGKKLLSIAGFTIIEIELGNPLLGDAATVTVDASSYRKNPCWTSDGMVEGIWEDLFTSVDRLPTKHFSAQVYTRHQRVFSRTDQNRCGYILNLEN
jgi:hypothetical protein